MISLSKPIVLIVEDEVLIRMLAVDVFLSQGFAVLEAAHAAEALEVHGASETVNLLFTDVNMPGDFDGIDLAERLRERCPAIKIIVTSALPIPRPVNDLPATFMTKPYDIEVVCSAAKDLLAA